MAVASLGVAIGAIAPTYFETVLFCSHSCLSADIISSALLVRLREEGRRRKKEEGGGLFSNSLVELEELKVWEC